MAKLPRDGKKAAKAKKPKDRVDSDDIVDLIEFAIEEGTGFGIVKRGALKIRRKIAKEFIDKIEQLTKENIGLVKTIQEMSEISGVLIKVVTKQEAEIVELKGQLRKQQKKKNITPK